jgi:hypothetical protein
MNDPKVKALYHKALGPLLREPWLANLDGPSSENKPVKVAGADYVLISTCENRNCYQNSVVLLWSGAQNGKRSVTALYSRGAQAPTIS